MEGSGEHRLPRKRVRLGATGLAMVITLLGIVILLVALLDVFFTVLDANGFSLLSRRVYRWMWWLWRHGARILPAGVRTSWLSVGAPLMIPASVAVWFGLVIVGFALIYFGGMSPENFFFGGGSQPSLDAAFRLSWVTLSTIGFVEISPSSTSYSFTVAAEAILGGVILTLALTYFLRVHNVLLQFHTLATSLHHHAGDIARPESYLSTHIVAGEPRSLEPWLHDLVDGVVQLHEGLRRHPIVYFFHPRRRWRSLPYLIHTLSHVAAGLRWGVPRDSDVHREPSLRALIAATTTMIDDLEHQFVPMVWRSRVVPMGFSDFRQCVADHDWIHDPWVDRFLTLDGWMRDLLRQEAPVDPAEMYARYREWLPFAATTHDFVQATAWDLGYGRELRPSSEDVLDLAARWQSKPTERPQPLTGAEELRS